MKKNTGDQGRLPKVPEFQKRAIENLLAQTRPVAPVEPVFRQWLLWLVLAGLMSGLVLAFLRPQADLWGQVLALPNGSFLILLFAGSALAAWNGIASSVPGEGPGKAAVVWMVAVLAALVAIPLFFFRPDHLKAVLDHDTATGFFCFRTVVLVALPSWILLAWMVSRNASVRPGLSGFWLGVSAFLLGTGIVQVHCSHWETTHVLVNHLLPLGIFIALPIWVGSYWFSRWER
ncbi:MAG TPA: NrsF family protein [bacterium]|nr:NrsF family protein [bacterium]